MCKYAIFALLFFSQAFCCTGIVKKAEDGTVVYARTMEFGADILSFDLLFVPSGTPYESETHNKWATKYAYVGFSPFNMPLVADGLNEKGLACGGFYFPGWAEYQKVSANEMSQSISNLDFISWVLGNFTSVSEVKEALNQIKVVGLVFGPWGIIPPLHYVVADKTGEKAVIEYVKGELFIYPMQIDAITNAPPYDWHLLNARNYIGLHALNDPSLKINGMELSQFGQGSGALGLPGDFTPPSRMIRAAFFNQVVMPGKDSLANVKRAFKILNQFDIPQGLVRQKNSDGKEILEETQWTSASDLAGLKYYFHTYQNRSIRSVDLKKLIQSVKASKSIPINTPEEIQDISHQF